MDYKIEQAVLRLTQNNERNKNRDLVKFRSGILRINENRSEPNWIIIVYLFLLIITPLGYLVYSLLFFDDYIIPGLLILITTTFIFLLRKMVIGNNT